jgi:hypothetical protein
MARRPAFAIKPDQAFQAGLPQLRHRTGRIMEGLGPWSLIGLEPGKRVLAFADPPASSRGLDQCLETATRLAIRLPDASYPFALEDVSLGTTLKRRPRFPAILGERETQAELLALRERMGPIMARFLVDAANAEGWARVADLIYGLIEAGDAVPLLRAELLRHVVDRIGLEDDFPLRDRVRLARALVRMLKEPPATSGVLHERVLQTDLRAVLLDESEQPLFKVAEAVPDAKEREALVRALADLEADDEVKQQVTAWLQGK